MSSNNKSDIFIEKMISLIKEYIACAEYSCLLLKELYDGPETFLYAYKVLKLLPKEGKAGVANFQFHGRGCLFEYENDRIDIDFGPDGRRCDGFNLFRITDFIKFRKERYIEIFQEIILKELFEQFIRNNIIMKHPKEPDGHLYYLKEKLE